MHNFIFSFISFYFQKIFKIPNEDNNPITVTAINKIMNIVINTITFFISSFSRVSISFPHIFSILFIPTYAMIGMSGIILC